MNFSLSYNIYNQIGRYIIIFWTIIMAFYSKLSLIAVGAIGLAQCE